MKCILKMRFIFKKKNKKPKIFHRIKYRGNVVDCGDGGGGVFIVVVRVAKPSKVIVERTN